MRMRFLLPAVLALIAGGAFAACIGGQTGDPGVIDRTSIDGAPGPHMDGGSSFPCEKPPTERIEATLPDRSTCPDSKASVTTESSRSTRRAVCA